jgi:hypothetical protein
MNVRRTHSVNGKDSLGYKSSKIEDIDLNIVANDEKLTLKGFLETKG